MQPFIYAKFGLLPFMVEMAHQSPIGQRIHFVPNLAKLNAECAITGLKQLAHRNVPLMAHEHICTVKVAEELAIMLAKRFLCVCVSLNLNKLTCNSHD